MIDWTAAAYGAGVLAAAVAAAIVAHWLTFRLLAIATRRNAWFGDDAVVAALRAPLRLLFPLLAVGALLPLAPGLDAAGGMLRHATGVGVIAALTWLAVALVDAGARIVTRRHDVSQADNLEARRVHTQILVLERTLAVVIVALGLAAALMTFPRVREIGQSLLVSAGVAGLAIGLAARPVLENLIAGLQLAFTQPIRVDDVVIVEGEWGRIEEITATYVVVAIWDERRLVVPFSRFISEPFQNWTRRSADILGTVFLHADYTVPVDAVREELERLCAEHPLWDGRVCVLQVTNANDRTVELRALVSASDSGRAWDLRVDLRERLIAFLQRDYPECLPRTRITGCRTEPPDG
ncbi:MAG: mechanosensitive ion channel family protein [Gammaproteobacteria bacterium]